MLKLIKLLMLSALVGSAVIACSDSNEQDPTENVRQASKEPAMQNKTFLSACSTTPLQSIATGIATGGDARIKAGRMQFEFIGANVTHSILLYNTADCSGSVSVIYKESGTFRIDDGQRTSDDAKFIDLNYSRLNVNTVNQEGAEIAHALKLCGTEDWVAGTDREVTDQAGNDICYRRKEPRSNKQVYKLDGSTLYFGTKGLLASDDDRPTSLDTATPFVAN